MIFSSLPAELAFFLSGLHCPQSPDRVHLTFFLISGQELFFSSALFFSSGQGGC